MTLCIDNRTARRLWLDSQLLACSPTGHRDALQIIEQLGFVQLDSIANVVRAHHHILWSRHQRYRGRELDELQRRAEVFEHFTHDASVLPMSRYASWRRQFTRLGHSMARSAADQRQSDRQCERAILDRIAREGPLPAGAFKSASVIKPATWARPVHKQALDGLWYRGILATAYRKHFRKYYDLAERVIPETVRGCRIGSREQLDSLCEAAIERLVFASPGDLQRFWGACTHAEANDWIQHNAGRLQRVSVECADGSAWRLYALTAIEQRLADTRQATSRLRIINPFDPAIRNRQRTKRLFGFDYRNEIFVPPRERRFGYYVYPLLEGERFVGRIELRAERRKGALLVCQLWCEPGIRWTHRRLHKLCAELERLKRFAALEHIDWRCPQPAPTQRR